MSEKYHLGYFNAPEDIKYLADKSNKEIVEYKLAKNGDWHSTSIHLETASVQGLHPVEASNGYRYYVRRSIDRKNLDGPDNFIDIYGEC